MNDSKPVQRAHAAALRLLSYGPRSEAEVRDRLLRRFPEPLVAEVMEALREQALVDDASFARMWTESRESLKPRSASAVKRELLAKGIDRAVAEEAVRDMDEEEGAYRAGLKPTRRLGGADFPTFHRKLWGYLQRRGFSNSVSRHTIDRLWEEMSHESHPQKQEKD